MTPNASPSSIHTRAVQLQRATAPTLMMALSTSRSLVEAVLLRTDLGRGNSNYSDIKNAGAGAGAELTAERHGRR